MTFENKKKRPINKIHSRGLRYFYLCDIHRTVKKETNWLNPNYRCKVAIFKYSLLHKIHLPNDVNCSGWEIRMKIWLLAVIINKVHFCWLDNTGEVHYTYINCQQNIWRLEATQHVCILQLTVAQIALKTINWRSIPQHYFSQTV